MNLHILVAILVAVLNVILSSTVPCLLKKSQQPFLQQVKKVFETNRQVILTSSLIVGLTTLLALKLADEIQLSNNNLLDNTEDSASLNNLLSRHPFRLVSNMNNMPNSNSLSMLAKLYE